MLVEKQKKNLQCGSCTYLIRDKVFETRCSDIGKLPSSKGCNSHNPDAYTLVSHSGDEKVTKLLDLAHVISHLSPNDLQILAGLLLREKITRKNGFNFLQKVYVRVHGNANQFYLNDFITGYVLDATKEKVRVVSDSGLTCISALNSPDSLTLYSTWRFAELRKWMLQNRHLANPTGRKAAQAADPFADAVQALDSINPKFMSNKKVVKEPKDDLTSLVGKLGRGIFKLKRHTDASPEDTEIGITHE